VTNHRLQTADKSAARRAARRLRRALSLEAQLATETDEELRARLEAVRARLADGEPSRAGRDEAMAEVFAVVREAADRAIGQRPYPVQLLGGLVIADGGVAEMATGEGKTLTAVAPLVWYALHGRGAHLVTANDYLASRDAAWMRPVYEFCGLEIAYVRYSDRAAVRRAGYAADVTYATISTVGFDHLSDHLVFDPALRVQREPFAAIVDEADSLLLDEGRTPLIIAGQVDRDHVDRGRYADLVAELDPDTDFEVNWEDVAAYLTEAGIARVEALLGIENLYGAATTELHAVHQALQARAAFIRDKDYIVSADGDVIIVDENTGRLKHGNRFQYGIHEAIEAKEGLAPKPATVTSAEISVQAVVGRYTHRGGMTGTAMDAAAELEKTYGVWVAQVPTHRPLARIDHDDVLYITHAARQQAVIAEIVDRHRSGQPILVGTPGVEASEELAAALTAAGVTHQVLNARDHRAEAATIAQAGRRGAVTVTTNMAGRGVDIRLGGDPDQLALAEVGPAPDDADEHTGWQAALDAAAAHWAGVCASEREEVIAAGGLCVLGTTRFASRRVDNQLRGRSGRQGEPGETRFFLSCDDELVQVFGGDRIRETITRLAAAPDLPVTHPMLVKAVNHAQGRLEGMHAESRTSLRRFDGVYSAQREAYYAMREWLLTADTDELLSTVARRGFEVVLRDVAAGSPVLRDDITAALDAQGAPADLRTHLAGVCASYDLPDDVVDAIHGERVEVATEALAAALRTQLDGKLAVLDDDATAALNTALRRHIVAAFDRAWAFQLTELDTLRAGIGFRQMARERPDIAFARSAFALYGEMLDHTHRKVLRIITSMKLTRTAAATTS
jgi:preprotein translocase subunit SecA